MNLTTKLGAIWGAVIIAVAVLVTPGCVTPKRTSPQVDGVINQVRAQIATQYAIIGVDPALAKNVSISVKICPATGHNVDGPYVCGGDCAEIKDCVHAWELSGIHSDNASWMFADPPGDWCIRHEVGHFVQRRWCDDPAELDVANGHPTAVHLLGKLVQTKTLIQGARWPAFVRGLQFWREDQGDHLGCVVRDVDGSVVGQLRINEGMEGDGI